MGKVFADTAYWIAIINRKDQWSGSATTAKKQLGRQVRLVTTDEVLAEVLAAFSGKRKQLGVEEGMHCARW